MYQPLSQSLAQLKHETLLREAALARSAQLARKVGTDRVRLPRASRALKPTLALLGSVPLFKGLSKRELAFVARQVDRFRLPEGATLISEDRPAPQFVMLTKGVVESTRDGSRILIMGPGDHFGELTLFGRPTSVPTVMALTDVEGMVLGRQQFWDTLYSVPILAPRLTTMMAQQLRATRRRLIRLEEEHVEVTSTHLGVPDVVQV